jgi:hypothetical protein
VSSCLICLQVISLKNPQIRSISKSVFLEKISYRRNFRHQVRTSDVYRMYHHCSDQGSSGGKLNIHWNFRHKVGTSNHPQKYQHSSDRGSSGSNSFIRRNLRPHIGTSDKSSDLYIPIECPLKPKHTSSITPTPSPFLCKTPEAISRINRGISLLGVFFLDSPLLERSDPQHLPSDSRGKSSRWLVKREGNRGKQLWRFILHHLLITRQLSKHHRLLIRWQKERLFLRFLCALVDVGGQTHKELQDKAHALTLRALPLRTLIWQMQGSLWSILSGLSF